DEKKVSGITPYLSAPNKIAGNPFRLLSNSSKASKGVDTYGTGFILDDSEKERLLKSPGNKQVIFPYINGAELNSIPDQVPCKWIINFRDWPLNQETAPVGYKGQVASDFPECLRIVEERVKPDRLSKAADVAKAPWWQFWRMRSELEAS